MARKWNDPMELDKAITEFIATRHLCVPGNLPPLKRYATYLEKEAAPYVPRSVRQMKRDRKDRLHNFYTPDGEGVRMLGEDIAKLVLIGRRSEGDEQEAA